MTEQTGRDILAKLDEILVELRKLAWPNWVVYPKTSGTVEYNSGVCGYCGVWVSGNAHSCR